VVEHTSILRFNLPASWTANQSRVPDCFAPAILIARPTAAGLRSFPKRAEATQKYECVEVSWVKSSQLLSEVMALTTRGVAP
jgi:hypothetical protein